jgi:hypothetical protein
MPVVIFYKDGDIGLLHYNLQSHDDYIKAVNRVENKNVNNIILYTCKEREKIEFAYKEFYNFCSKLKVKNYDINTSSAKLSTNVVCLCSNLNNNNEHTALLSFATY